MSYWLHIYTVIYMFDFTIALAELEQLVELYDDQQWSCLPPEIVARFHHWGLWKLWVPKEYGGHELDLPQSLALIRSLSRINPTLGWMLAIGAGGGLFAGWMMPSLAQAVFTPKEALIAGSGALSGRYQKGHVDGVWGYCSGIAHATWVTAAVEEVDSGRCFAIAMPRSSVITRDDWHTPGLKGTGSVTMVADHVAITPEQCFDLMAPPHLERPLYQFPFMTLARLAFLMVIAGICQRLSDLAGDPLCSEHVTLQSNVILTDLADQWSGAENVSEEAWAARVALSAEQWMTQANRLVFRMGLSRLNQTSRIWSCYADLCTAVQHRLLKG